MKTLSLLKNISIALVFVCFVGFIVLNNIILSNLKSKLEVSEEAYKAQILENIKSNEMFKTAMIDSFKQSNDVIISLNEQIEFETRRADIAEKLTKQTILDQDRIQIKFNEDKDKLKALINANKNECTDTKLPNDFVELLQSIPL